MEKFKLYNSEGKVEDPKIAEEMALTEKPFREKKRLRFFKPGERQVLEGEREAEQIGRILIDEKNEAEEAKQAINNEETARRELKKPDLTKEDVYILVQYIKSEKERIKFLEDAKYERITKGNVTKSFPVKSDKIIREVLAELYEKIGDKENADRMWRYTKNKEKVLGVIKEKMIKIMLELHSIKPEIIFLTQSSATLYGWMIKEAWRNSWPDEPLPAMLTIDVHPIKYPDFRYSKEMLKDKGYASKTAQEFLSELVKKAEENIQSYHAEKNIVIVDESVVDGITLKRSKMVLEEAIRNLNKSIQVHTIDLHEGRETEGPFRRFYEFEPEHKGREGREGLLVLNREEKREAKQKIEEFKYYGTEIGREIKKRESD